MDSDDKGQIELLKQEIMELRMENEKLQEENKKLKDFIHKQKLYESIQWAFPLDKTK